MVFGINIVEKVITLIYYSTFGLSSNNKTTDSTSSSRITRKGLSNISLFIFNAVKNFLINISVTLLILLNIIERTL